MQPLAAEHIAVLLERLSEGVLLVQPDGAILKMNAEALRIHGLSDASKLHTSSDLKTVLELRDASGDTVPFSQWPISRVLKNEQFDAVELTIVYRDAGAPSRLCSFGSVPLRDEHGRLTSGALTVRDITEERRLKRATQASEERLALALDASNIGFYDWDIQRDEVLFSAQMHKDWGIPENHGARLQDATALIHPDDRPRVQREIQRCIDERLELSTEYRVVRPNDRQIVWVEIRGEIEYESTGEPLRFIGTCINVTPRKQIEDSERQAKLKLRLALHAGQMATWHVDLNTFKASISPEVARIFGVGQVDQEDVSSIISRVIHPDDRDAANAALSEAITKREPYSHEYRVIWPSGEVRWVLAQGDLALDAETPTEAYAGVILDITARKRAEQELRAYSEAMPQMAFIASASGEIFYYNQRHYTYFGIDVGEHDGWGWRDSDRPILHPDDLERTVQTWSEALSTGTTYEIEYRLRRHDGVYRWHLGRAVPVKDERGQITRWYGTNTDMHEAKELTERLQDAVAARDDFLSIASHELKTPLTSLKLQAQIHARAIAKQDPLAYAPARVLKLVEQTEKQVQRITRLVDDMLDVSRIRAGKLTIEREDFDLRELVRDVVERMRLQFTAAGYDVPRLDSPNVVDGAWDRLRIEQVVTNLLTNAIRYGGGKPIDIRVESDVKRVRLKVRDQGIGIAPGNQEKIFGRFERAVNASEISGLGLGLFITRQIVRAHDGEIRVESLLGQGSTFIVELPRRS